MQIIKNRGIHNSAFFNIKNNVFLIQKEDIKSIYYTYFCTNKLNIVFANIRV